MKTKMHAIFHKLIERVHRELKGVYSFKSIATIAIGAFILAFVFTNIHQQVNMAGGGTFGMVLLINHWLGLPTYLVAPFIDLVSYAVAFKFLGSGFLKIAAVSTISLSLFLKLFEQLPLFLPDLSHLPLVAAFIGGVLVGIGSGLIIRVGGSAGGDDALALTISKLTGLRIAMAYMIIDGISLALSLTYIAPSRIVFSLIIAVVSSVFVDITKSVKLPKTTFTPELLGHRIICMTTAIQAFTYCKNILQVFRLRVARLLTIHLQISHLKVSTFICIENLQPLGSWTSSPRWHISEG